jgi:hypothetical protein
LSSNREGQAHRGAARRVFHLVLDSRLPIDDAG